MDSETFVFDIPKIVMENVVKINLNLKKLIMKDETQIPFYICYLKKKKREVIVGNDEKKWYKSRNIKGIISLEPITANQQQDDELSHLTEEESQTIKDTYTKLFDLETKTTD